MNKLVKATGLVFVGVVAGISLQTIWHSEGGAQTSEKSKEPLYWVAPMDSNYRRDKPGKSPMGMDLVPVYEESSASEHGEGAIQISPTVVNNLGVSTQTVKTQAWQQSVNVTGQILANPNRQVQINPRVAGWVTKLHVKANGDFVKAGEALYTLYAPELVHAQEEYLIAKKRGNQALISAAKARLIALGFPNAALKALNTSNQVAQEVSFKAPLSGYASQINLKEGAYIKPEAMLFTLTDLDELWLEFDVFSDDAPLLSRGMLLTVAVNYQANKTINTQLDYIYPIGDAQTRTIKARAVLDNKAQLLKPNMLANVTLNYQSDEPTMQVPASSVIRTGLQNRVVVALGDGYFKSVAVTLGRISDKWIEITSGLLETDKVVTRAQFLIDSESSKTSDFMRMSAESAPESVWVAGEVKSLMKAHKMGTISHEPIDVWDWPAMTMDFTFSEQLDISELQEGHQLHMEISKKADGGYEITGIHIMGMAEPEPVPSATVSGRVNQLDAQKRIINISRDAIEKWNRGPATMDFVLAEGLDVSLIEAGMAVIFTFEIRDDFVVTEITPEEAHSKHGGHE